MDIYFFRAHKKDDFQLKKKPHHVVCPMLILCPVDIRLLRRVAKIMPFKHIGWFVLTLPLSSPIIKWLDPIGK